MTPVGDEVPALVRSGGNTASVTTVPVTEGGDAVAGEQDASIPVVTAELTTSGTEAGAAVEDGAALVLDVGWAPLVAGSGDPALATWAMVSVTVVTSGSVSGEADEGGAG